MLSRGAVLGSEPRPKARSTPEACRRAWRESCRRAHGRSTSRNANSAVAAPATRAGTSRCRRGGRRSGAASAPLGGAIPTPPPATWGDRARARGWPERGRSFGSLWCRVRTDQIIGGNPHGISFPGTEIPRGIQQAAVSEGPLDLGVGSVNWPPSDISVFPRQPVGNFALVGNGRKARAPRPRLDNLEHDVTRMAFAAGEVNASQISRLQPCPVGFRGKGKRFEEKGN